MAPEEIDSLRAHYDTKDTSAAIEHAELDESVVDEPLVGITIQLPANTLDTARNLARSRGLSVTALLREWIEAQAPVVETDLDRANVTFRGERLTEARAEEIAAEILARADRAVSSRHPDEPAT
ncbi:hypothetical protein Q6348_07610 [Isoptericola sp. b441]|uniref:Ribbon-helix-helix protein CopG domain-containing protein n=1 Tax=Actinotalea lenta TaxID=3064654 RepID=A0ABT9DAA0_9CELL|nr:hypothetical protein [Isoptericola sp. b441]MDO8107063.1 hypothetical protein [Isoptericola sp. b441]